MLMMRLLRAPLYDWVVVKSERYGADAGVFFLECYAYITRYAYFVAIDYRLPLPIYADSAISPDAARALLLMKIRLLRCCQLEFSPLDAMVVCLLHTKIYVTMMVVIMMLRCYTLRLICCLIISRDWCLLYVDDDDAAASARCYIIILLLRRFDVMRVYCRYVATIALLMSLILMIDDAADGDARERVDIDYYFYCWWCHCLRCRCFCWCRLCFAAITRCWYMRYMILLLCHAIIFCLCYLRMLICCCRYDAIMFISAKIISMLRAYYMLFFHITPCDMRCYKNDHWGWIR